MGVEMPKYYKPGAVNPLNYAEQEPDFHHTVVITIMEMLINNKHFLDAKLIT